MALNFPASPTVGQLFPSPPTAGVPVWKWDGSEWVAQGGNGSTAFTQYEFTATAAQTSFSGTDNNGATLAYTVGYVEVYVNGVKLNKADFTATTGTSVVLASGANVGDQVTMVALATISSNNALVPTNNLSDVTSTDSARKNLGLPGILRGFLQGLTLSTAGSSTTFSVAAGAANDSTFTDFMTLASSINKTTGAWAVGSGNGALDTGSVTASTWYHVHLITNGTTVDVLVSLSATAPTMPSGYTLFRRIGSMKTDGSSNWLAFTQVGNTFLWSAPLTDYNAGATASTQYTISLVGVPTGVSVAAVLSLTYEAGASGNCFALLYTGLGATQTANTPAGNYNMYAYAASSWNASQYTLETNTSGQVRLSVGTNGFTTVTLSAEGWIDTRGTL